MIDKARGNILKVDRHKYVKVAMHGFKELSRDERVSTYNVVGRLHEFDEPRYALIDTLFSLAEAYLFMQLVEILDGDPDVLPVGKKYDDLYRDVRAGVDLAHRDGTIKRQVAKDPGMYIHEDPGVVSVLDSLRRSGKKIFLATNSLYVVWIVPLSIVFVHVSFYLGQMDHVCTCVRDIAGGIIPMWS